MALTTPEQKQLPDFSALEGIKKQSLMSVYFAVSVAAYVLTMIISAKTGNAVPLMIVMALSVVGLLIVYLQQKKLKKANIEKFAQFAVINNFDYVNTNRPTGNESGTVFGLGTDRRLVNIIAGRIRNLPFRTFEYKYTIRRGKSTHTIDLQVFEITLPRILPHMVIDSLVEYGNWNGSALPISFDKSQKIELEGDFHKYFALYAPDKYGISALSIIAPDAMEALMRYAAMCDIEIIDNKIYFLWADVANSKQQYEKIFETINGVMAEIEDKLTRGDIFAHDTHARVHAEAAEKGVRLKKSRWPGRIIVGAIIFYFASVMFQDIIPYGVREAIYWLGMGGVYILTFIGIVWSLLQSRRKRNLQTQLRQRNYN